MKTLALPIAGCLLLGWVLSAHGPEAAELPPAPVVSEVNTVDAATYMPHAHFSWAAVPSAWEYAIEIARDPGFAEVVDHDRSAVVHRYVPLEGLEPGRYFWRVRSVDPAGNEGPWSDAREFAVRRPPRTFTIPRRADIATIHRIVRQAIAAAPAQVVFEPGEYRIDPHGAASFLPVIGARDLIIDARGASVTLAGQCNIVQLWDSENVLVRNLTVDYDPLPYTAGRVIAIDRTSGTFDVAIEPGHPDLDANPKFLREAKSLLYDARRMRVKEGVPIVVTTRTDFRKLGDRAWRIALHRPKEHTLLDVGDVYLNAPRGPAGFDVKNCRHVTFAGNTVHSTCGIGFATHYASGMNILGHQFRRKEGRYLVVQNGGTNIHNSRIGPWIEGCWFENTGDDCNHINSLVMYVSEVLERKRVALREYRNVCPQARLDLRLGDELSLFDRPSGHELGRRHIKEVSYQEDAALVTLDGPIPAIRTADHNEPTQVFNASRCAGQFVFRGNTFRRGRRLGILAKGHEGLIEKNRFIELGGAGVDIWNAPYEGPNGDTILVRDNLFQRCGLAGNKIDMRWSIGSAVYRRDTAGRWHRSLTITNNRIIDSPTIGIAIFDAADVLIQNNLIANRRLDAFRGVDPCAIALDNTEDVALRGNRITDKRMAPLAGPIRVTNSQRVHLEPKEHTP